MAFGAVAVYPGDARWRDLRGERDALCEVLVGAKEERRQNDQRPSRTDTKQTGAGASRKADANSSEEWTNRCHEYGRERRKRDGARGGIV